MTYADKTERTLKEKGLQKKKIRKMQQKMKFLISTEVRFLKFKGHFSASCRNWHERYTQHEAGETRLGQNPGKRIL